MTLHLVDTVLVGGRIWTGSEDDDSMPNEVASIAIRDGRIVAVGQATGRARALDLILKADVIDVRLGAFLRLPQRATFARTARR